MNGNEDRSNEDYDIFVLNKIFPDAQALLSTRPKPIEEVKDECLIVLDTNALLVPFNTGKESINQIADTYSMLITQERLIIPGQVAREFARLRSRTLMEIYSQLIQKKGDAKVLILGRYPLLGELDIYDHARHLEKAINESVKNYKKSIDKILEEISAWNWDDPVSKLYSEIFKDGVVFDPVLDESSLLSDLDWRIIHSIPPGYKDKSKDDRGIGDLIIWHTMLQLAKERDRDVIFVSNDQKADWWYRSHQKALYPRFELVDEFRHKTAGHAFNIVSFSRFLAIFGASDDVVSEVKSREISRSETRELFALSAEAESFLHVAVYKYLEHSFDESIVVIGGLFTSSASDRDYLVDLFIDHGEGSRTAVDVLYGDKSSFAQVRRLIKLKTDSAEEIMEFCSFDNYILAVVFPDKETVESIPDEIYPSSIPREVEYYIGHRISDMNFFLDFTYP